MSRDRVRKIVGIGLISIAVAAVVLWLFGGEHVAERQAIRRLPPDIRRTIFAEELQVFQSLCGEQPRQDALETHCRNQAAFLAQFPECDSGCEQLVRDHFVRGWR